MTTVEIPSALEGDALAAIWRECEPHRSPFVDPVLMRAAQQVHWHVIPDKWMSRAVGHEVTSWADLSPIELAVMLRALQADRAYLNSVAEAARAERVRIMEEQRLAARAKAQADREQWAVLRDRLPVPVTVGHNWTARHLDPYVQGADHIVVQADLTAGRFHRNARDPLCFTPSRSHELRHVDVTDDGVDRMPTCKACLRHAERLAGS